MSFLVLGCPPQKDYLKLLIKPVGWDPEDEAGYIKMVFQEDKQVIVHHPDGTQYALTGDPQALHVDIAGEINGLEEKTEPVDDDVLVLEDSAAEWAKKKVRVAAIRGGQTFLQLTDTPTDYTGQAGKVVAVRSTEDGLEFVEMSSGGGGATTFLELTDTPSDYTGQAGKTVVVKSTEDGLEFVDLPSGEKVKVSSSDTTADYLSNKLVAGDNVTITVLNSGGNEQLRISATASGGSGSPGGVDKAVQFNQGGSFGGSSNLLYDYNGGGLYVKDDMTVKKIWFYDQQDPSSPAKAFVAMRPAQYRRVIFYGEPDGGDTFGFICAPSKADKTYNSFFGFWNTDWDQGHPSGSSYGGVLMEQDGSLKFFSYSNRVYFAPENKEGVYFVELGGKAAVGINNTSPQETLTVGVGGDGSRAIANEWATFSDRRLKEIVGEVKEALSIVDSLKPVLYKWKGGERVQAGFIAQDVAEVWKYATSGSGGVSCIDVLGLVALLTQAVKELYERVKKLEGR